ncbi:MAG: ribonuclease D [Phycisphaerae bacterium]
MPKSSIQTETANVTTQAEVDALCADCRKAGRFAFDTEFVMEDRFEPEACLLQLGAGNQVWIIDPLLGLDLQQVWQLVGHRDVEVIVHAGQEDLALAVQHTGQLPRNIFDVQIAAGFVGHDYPISLQKLIQSTLRIRLHKSKTLTDWRKRPLTLAQLQYAAEDVIYLHEVYRILRGKLEKLGRMEWVREECSKFEQPTLYERTEEDKLMRLKGTRSLSGPQLAIVQALLKWREGLAERFNRPARVLLKDHLLVEIARHQIAQFSEIRNLRGVNLKDTDVRALAKVVAAAMQTPVSEQPRPKPRERETPQEEVLAALITSVVRSYCLENRLSYSLVATQRSIRELIRHRASSNSNKSGSIQLLSGWRGESVGIMVDEVLSGLRSVRVEPTAEGLAVHVTPTA